MTIACKHAIWSQDQTTPTQVFVLFLISTGEFQMVAIALFAGYSCRHTYLPEASTTGVFLLFSDMGWFQCCGLILVILTVIALCAGNLQNETDQSSGYRFSGVQSNPIACYFSNGSTPVCGNINFVFQFHKYPAIYILSPDKHFLDNGTAVIECQDGKFC